MSVTDNSVSASMDRRRFLKLGGTGMAGMIVAGMLGSETAFAQNGKGKGSDRSELMQEFKDAAKEYGVPVGILLAMGYVNTRWEMPPPDASDYEEGSLHGWGGYGIMALVQNPSTNTLGEAAELTGLSEEELKTDRRANIRGGAALLAKSKGGSKPADPGKWLGAVSKGKGPKSSDAPSGIGGGEVYAEQVRSTLKRGARGKTKRGETVSLEARPEAGEGD